MTNGKKRSSNALSRSGNVNLSEPSHISRCRDITNIEGLGWQLQGNVIGLNFMLFDQNGEAIAAIGQKMLTTRRENDN